MKDMKVENGKNGEFILKEVYNTIGLDAGENEKFYICQRDGAFEFNYGDQWYTARDGKLTKVNGDHVNDTAEAVELIRKALKTDKGCFQSWKANITMAMYDEFNRSTLNADEFHRILNAGAESFLKLFCEDTKEEIVSDVDELHTKDNKVREDTKLQDCINTYDRHDFIHGDSTYWVNTSKLKKGSWYFKSGERLHDVITGEMVDSWDTIGDFVISYKNLEDNVNVMYHPYIFTNHEFYTDDPRDAKVNSKDVANPEEVMHNFIGGAELITDDVNDEFLVGKYDDVEHTPLSKELCKVIYTYLSNKFYKDKNFNKAWKLSKAIAGNKETWKRGISYMLWSLGIPLSKITIEELTAVIEKEIIRFSSSIILDESIVIDEVVLTKISDAKSTEHNSREAAEESQDNNPVGNLSHSDMDWGTALKDLDRNPSISVRSFPPSFPPKPDMIYDVPERFKHPIHLGSMPFPYIPNMSGPCVGCSNNKPEATCHCTLGGHNVIYGPAVTSGYWQVEGAVNLDINSVVTHTNVEVPVSYITEDKEDGNKTK